MNPKHALLLGSLLLAGCGKEIPSHVTTVNQGYRRASSHVLVRHVDAPTRARLDWAAWWDVHFREDTARCQPSPQTRVTSDALKFDGLFDQQKSSLSELPLTASERAEPMAWEPVRNQLLAWNFDAASKLAEGLGNVASRTWGDTSQCSKHAQVVTVWMHKTPAGNELWAEIEFAAGMEKSLQGFRDEDGDGHAEAFVRVAPGVFTKAMADFLQDDYLTRRLTRTQAKEWLNQMAGDGYLQYNTDILPPDGNVFPGPGLRTEISKEWTDSVKNPFCVVRGRPFGIPLYLVLVVDSLDAEGSAAAAGQGAAAGQALDTSATRRIDSLKQALTDLPDGPDAGTAALAGQILSKSDAASQAVAGRDGWLLFQRELQYLQARDTATQAADPVERIVSLRDSLAGLGIDFLFVPIPTKQDVVPNLIDPKRKAKGWAQPAIPHLCSRLAARGVESLDLLTSLQAQGKAGLWRKQDTHWDPSGIAIAAEALSRRLKGYSWFASLPASAGKLEGHDTSWNDRGDLVDRLPVAKRSAYRPETVRGKHIHLDGTPVQDDPASAILILGDSYTGVYHLVPPKASGITDLLALSLGRRVDLAMGWGGGPEAPVKLAQRGPDGLKGKRLVVWMMSARDLLAYPGGWAKH